MSSGGAELFESEKPQSGASLTPKKGKRRARPNPYAAKGTTSAKRSDGTPAKKMVMATSLAELTSQSRSCKLTARLQSDEQPYKLNFVEPNKDKYVPIPLLEDTAEGTPFFLYVLEPKAAEILKGIECNCPVQLIVISNGVPLCSAPANLASRYARKDIMCLYAIPGVQVIMQEIDDPLNKEFVHVHALTTLEAVQATNGQSFNVILKPTGYKPITFNTMGSGRTDVYGTLPDGSNICVPFWAVSKGTNHEAVSALFDRVLPEDGIDGPYLVLYNAGYNADKFNGVTTDQARVFASGCFSFSFFVDDPTYPVFINGQVYASVQLISVTPAQQSASCKICDAPIVEGKCDKDCPCYDTPVPVEVKSVVSVTFIYEDENVVVGGSAKDAELIQQKFESEQPAIVHVIDGVIQTIV
eukprot:m.8742 g.8742  ORF g.8742 m.8742 type:complete len:413 (+) comp9266_c0_seq3:1147-2385(+)